jgi:4-hydroxy-tetrahydrodipicolinate reductase
MSRVVVSGATGQTGGAVVAAGRERDGVEIVAGLASTAGEASRVPISPAAEAERVLREADADAVVDFSVPGATVAVAEAAADVGVPLVTGTTGFDDGQAATLDEAADAIPVLTAANFSRGVQALLAAVAEAVAALPGYDVELVETHHNRKVDAPSGTAEAIVDAVQEQRDVEPVYGREGDAPRAADEMGIFARRAGDVRGEHELLLAGNDEVLTLSHRAEDRGVYAAGALDAAEWLVGREPGRYEFADAIHKGGVDEELL